VKITISFTVVARITFVLTGDVWFFAKPVLGALGDMVTGRGR
jgi:hypothetical protein